MFGISIPEMHQEGCNDCCNWGLGPVNQYSCHESLIQLKFCNLSPKELLDWGETNTWMMLWKIWASVLTHVPYLLTVRGPLVSWCKRPKWPVSFSWHFVAKWDLDKSYFCYSSSNFSHRQTCGLSKIKQKHKMPEISPWK